MKRVTINLYSQSGATLLVTLMVVLMVSFIAVMAFRKSNTDLTVSTTAQVQTVVFQSSDMGISILEQQATNGLMKKDIIPLLHTPDPKDKIGNEITLCIRPRGSFLDKSKLTERLDDSLGGGVLHNQETGHCKPTQDDDFVSGRKITLVQMTLEKQALPTKEKFANENDGTNLPKNYVPISFKATSTALLPAFSTANNTDVETCMKKTAKVKTDNIDNCLVAKKIPLKTTEQDYIYRVFKGLE